MELDELKEYLKHKKEGVGMVDKPSEKLTLLLKSNPKSPINKIKRNLVIEIISAFLIIFILVYYCVVINIWSIRVYILLLLAVYIVCLIPYFRLYNKIKSLNNTVLPIKKNLEEIHETMTLFIRDAIQFIVWSIPVFYTIAAALGFYQGKKGRIPEIDNLISNIHTPHHIHNPVWLIVFLLVFIIALTVGVALFMKWLLKKVYALYYGKYLDELKRMLEYLEE